MAPARSVSFEMFCSGPAHARVKRLMAYCRGREGLPMMKACRWQGEPASGSPLDLIRANRQAKCRFASSHGEV